MIEVLVDKAQVVSGVYSSVSSQICRLESYRLTITLYNVYATLFSLPFLTDTLYVDTSR